MLSLKNAREGDILRQGVFCLNIWAFCSFRPKNKAKTPQNWPFCVRVKRRKRLYTVPVKKVGTILPKFGRLVFG
jgi:hypothetical protein